MGAIAFWRASQYTGTGDWLDESGNSHDATFTGPTFRAYDGTKYLALDGDDDNYASTPDAAALDIVGDLDLRVWWALDDWTPAAYSPVLSKALYAGNHRAYAHAVLGSGGELKADWSATGASWLGEQSTVATGFTDGTLHWTRQTLDVDNGASGYDVAFYYGDNGVDWTPLGTTVVGGATTSIDAGNAQVEVGRRQLAAGYGNTIGKIYRAQIYDGIGGTLVFDANFDTAVEPYATFVDSSAQAATITINRAATGRPALIVDRDTMWVGTDTTDWFEVADHANLDFAGNESFTVAFYGRVYDATPAADMVLIGKKDDLSTAAGYSVYLDTGGTINGLIADGTNTTTASSAVITAGYSFVVTLVRDVTADTLQMYLNGVASGSSQTDTTTATLVNARPLRMGAHSAATPGNYLSGEIMGGAVFRWAQRPTGH
jgi:hypothetical protein